VTRPPADVADLAEARSQARAAHDWAEADRLKAAIEAEGWKVVDRGLRSVLSLAARPDVVEGDRVRYGQPEAVPSRLTEPASARVTVVTRATDDPLALGRLLTSLRAHAPDGTQLVVVADAPEPDVAALLAPPDGPISALIGGSVPEVIWTATRFGVAGAVDAALRRAVGRVAILVDPRVELTGDAVTPLGDALDDPTVAVVGPWGLASSDLRHWQPAETGDVDAIEWSAIAFRRDDLIARGPLDPAFRTTDYLGVWWSLVLRDAGEGVTPRRALGLADLPVVFHADPAAPDGSGSSASARPDKRAFYRVLRAFGGRPDLLAAGRSDRGPAAP